jgi:[ribosomal protein S5]-alanine N-acetyltransferase
MKNPYLIGSQVYLRAVEMSDGPVIVPWLNDPAVSRTLLHRRALNLRAEEEFLERVAASEHDLVLGIALKADDRLIGATGFHQIDFRNRHACFGITIGIPEAWGKGYGTEATRLMVNHAFETMNLNRVWLQVFEYNLRALRTYEKIGFKKEGTLRQENFREGRYWDTHVMGLLRQEWDAERDRLA